MKISDFPETNVIPENGKLLVDNGHSIYRISPSDALSSSIGKFSSNVHRQIFRGENLGSSLTTEQKSQIQNGSFTDLYIGDYWLISGVKWRIADFDYWYGVNDMMNKHHVVVVNDGVLYQSAYEDALVEAKNYIRNLFGSTVDYANETDGRITNVISVGNLICHPEFIDNEWTVYDTDVVFPTVAMMFGLNKFNGSNKGCDRQLALYKLTSTTNREPDLCWLRDRYTSIDGRLNGTSTTGPIIDTETAGVKIAFALG